MLVEFTVAPLGEGDRLSEYVAPIIDLVAESGLDYTLTAMGTIVEGDWDDIMILIEKCHFTMKKRAERVITTIKIDDHGKRKGRLKGKVDSVKSKMKNRPGDRRDG